MMLVMESKRMVKTEKSYCNAMWLYHFHKIIYKKKCKIFRQLGTCPENWILLKAGTAWGIFTGHGIYCWLGPFCCWYYCQWLVLWILRECSHASQGTREKQRLRGGDGKVRGYISMRHVEGETVIQYSKTLKSFVSGIKSMLSFKMLIIVGTS